MTDYVSDNINYTSRQVLEISLGVLFGSLGLIILLLGVMFVIYLLRKRDKRCAHDNGVERSKLRGFMVMSSSPNKLRI